MRNWQQALAAVVQLSRRGTVLVGRCPFHDERTASFNVYHDGHYHCYGCGKHGWCEELLGEKVPMRNASYLQKESEPFWPALEWEQYRAEAVKFNAAKRLFLWRGYKLTLCEWLVRNDHVGMFEGQFAFPIRRGCRVVRLHVRRNERVDWKGKGKQPFFYHPTTGASVDAMQVRVGNADVADVFESQWDAFAVMSEVRSAGLYVATRGASNARKLASIHWPAKVRLWPQNDAAAVVWTNGVRATIPARCVVEEIQLPSSVKDANDYLKQGGNLKELL